MKCPNCGYEISDNDMICRGCGQSVVMLKQKYNIKDEVKKEPQVSLLEIAGMTKEEAANIEKEPVYETKAEEPKIPEKYLEAYIGPNYHYFKKYSFSFWSLLLGPVYWAYRGYLYQGVIVAAIFSSLLMMSLFYASPLIVIVLYLMVCVYMAFTFKKQYLKKCQSQISVLLKVIKDDEKLLTTLKKQGNPSYFGPVLLVAVLLFVTFIVRLILALLYNLM